MHFPVARRGDARRFFGEEAVKPRKVVVCLVLLAVVILLNLPVPASLRVKNASRDNIAPFQNVMSFVLDRTLRIGSYLAEAGRAAGERERLLTQVATLREDVRRLEALERDNAELRGLLGFRDTHRYKLVIAEVVERGDASGWWQTLTLNKGSEDRIAPDMAVITTRGLVGRTADVSHRTTLVRLITDPTCRGSCKFSRTGAFGILRGGGVSLGGDPRLAMFFSLRPFRMDYISKEQKVFENDEVVTSGLGGVYPEGLSVGAVAKTDLDPSGLYQRADIVPAADMSGLKYVFVVLQ